MTSKNVHTAEFHTVRNSSLKMHSQIDLQLFVHFFKKKSTFWGLLSKTKNVILSAKIGWKKTSHIFPVAKRRSRILLGNSFQMKMKCSRMLTAPVLLEGLINSFSRNQYEWVSPELHRMKIWEIFAVIPTNKGDLCLCTQILPEIAREALCQPDLRRRNRNEVFSVTQWSAVSRSVS